MKGLTFLSIFAAAALSACAPVPILPSDTPADLARAVSDLNSPAMDAAIAAARAST